MPSLTSQQQWSTGSTASNTCLPQSDHAGWGLGQWIMQQSKAPIAAITVAHALLLAPWDWLGASCQPLGPHRAAQQLNSSQLSSCIMA